MENSENSLRFTEAENKIRKKWLFWSIILPAAVFGCCIIVAMIGVFIASSYILMTGILLSSLIFAGGLYMTYYCAYKNPGTVLLLLGMIGIPLNLLITFLKPENLALMKASVFFLLCMLMMLFFALVVLYYSYKLRKINKKMQERKLIASPVYINALPVFLTATNLEELNEQFIKLRASDNSENTVQALAKAYNQQKKMLKLANNSLKT